MNLTVHAPTLDVAELPQTFAKSVQDAIGGDPADSQPMRGGVDLC